MPIKVEEEAELLDRCCWNGDIDDRRLSARDGNGIPLALSRDNLCASSGAYPLVVLFLDTEAEGTALDSIGFPIDIDLRTGAEAH